MSNITITKKSGETVPFDINKLKTSLINSGASQNNADHIAGIILNNIVDGMSTHKVYSLAYRLLRKQSGKAAGRYRLKKAIFDLGPTGYPFESLVSELLKSQGFETKTGQLIKGACVLHEVDVLALKQDKTIFVECKFHNDISKKSDVKVSLYVNSRFHDLKKKQEQTNNSKHNYEGWLVTNTRFSKDAVQYGVCAGLKMISWDFPAVGNLRQLIDNSGFHPITTMQSLTKKDKTYLMENGIVLCKQLPDHTDILRKIGINEKRISKIVTEANQIITQG